MEFDALDNIILYKVKNKEEGTLKSFELLQKGVSSKSALFISGAADFLPLYRLIIHDPSLSIVPAVLSSTDGRYEEGNLTGSSEAEIKGTGLYEQLSRLGTKIVRVFEEEKGETEEIAKMYEVKVREIMEKFSHRLALLDIGEDGRVAGIYPNYEDWVDPVFLPENASRLTVSFEKPDPNQPKSKIVTLTFNALSKMSQLIVFAYGEDKQEVLKVLMQQKDIDVTKLPAGFIREVGIETHLITDQEISFQ